SVFDHDVATLDVTEVTQSLTEGIAPLRVTGQVGRQVAYSSDLGRLLSLRSERRKSEAESENDREPDQRHGHLGGEWLAGAQQTWAGAIVTESERPAPGAAPVAR